MSQADKVFLEELILDKTFREYVFRTSASSKKKWEEYLKKNPQKQQDFETATQVVQLLSKNPKKKKTETTETELRQLLAKIEIQSIEQKKSVKLHQTFWFRIAASIILLFSISTALYLYFFPEKPIVIPTAYNEIIVPIGEKTQIILSDGTHIWINSGSKFRYPAVFSDSTRSVYLEGEAYFDVKKMHEKPFIVSTDAVKIRVLGTAFNVKCYPTDKRVETTVVRGKVQVEDKITHTTNILLSQNDKLVITGKSNKTKQMTNLQTIVKQPQDIQIISELEKKVNADIVTAWKDQNLIFSNERFEDLCVKMERWYNVKIKIQDDKLKNERFRGKFVNNETIYQVLDVFKLTSQIKYKVQEDVIYITK